MKKVITTFLMIITSILFSQTTSISDGNWNTPSIWSTNIIPGNNTNVIINHNVMVTTIGSKCKNLTINDTLVNTNFLEVRGNLTNNGTYINQNSTLTFKTNNPHVVSGTILTTNLIIPNNVTVNLTSRLYVIGLLNVDGVLNSNGFLSLYADSLDNGRLGKSSGVVTGNFTSQIYVSRCNKWSVYGVPFTSSYNIINDSTSGRMIYTGFPASDYPTFSFTNVYQYTEGIGYVSPTNVSNNVNRGKGYYYWNSDTVFNTLNPVSIPQKWKISTTGNMNLLSGFTYNVTYSPSDGWNLLANPYPGTIDWKDNSWIRSNVSNVVYTYNTCNQNNAAWSNGISVNGGSRYISQYQGFWVQSIGSSPFLSSPSSVIVDNSSAMLKSAALPPNTLMISSYSGRDETAIGFDTLATNTIDDIDALWNDPSNRLYSIKNGKYLINFTPIPLNDTIGLGVYGTDTLTFSGIETFTYHSVFLLDTLLNTTFTLYSGYKHPYSVTGFNDNRYKIIFQPIVTSLPELSSTIQSNRKLVKTINLLGQEIDPNNYTGVVIFIYSDGSSKKVFKQ